MLYAKGTVEMLSQFSILKIYLKCGKSGIVLEHIFFLMPKYLLNISSSLFTEYMLENQALSLFLYNLKSSIKAV